MRIPIKSEQENSPKRKTPNRYIQAIAKPSVAYFSLVMATGIVSIAAHLFSYSFVAKQLFYINIVAYVILCIRYAALLIFYSKNFISDFIDPSKSAGYLTFVAASCILGNQFILIFGNYQIAFCFLLLGVISWLFLIYTFFTIVTVKHKKLALNKAINGLWLLVIVSTQSISVLGMLLAQHVSTFRLQLQFFSFAMFLLGCMFYFIIIALIVYRLSFFELRDNDFIPSYWINMGAAAITAFAGSTFSLNVEKIDFFSSLIPFIKGITLMFWSFASWWIPFLIILDVRRHIFKKLPFQYHPQYWSIIFPLGMYTVCTVKLSQELSLPFLMEIPSVFIFISIVTWIIVFISMLVSICKYTLKKR